MKSIKKTSVLLGFLSLIAVFAFAKQEKFLQIFRNGEILHEYSINDIDYVEINDVTPAPGNINASLSNGQITVTWNPVEGAVYNVYRSEDNVNFSLLASGLTATFHTDTAPLSGTNFYTVSAVIDGLESAHSQSAGVVVEETTLSSGIYLGIIGFSKGFQSFPIEHLSEDNTTSYHSFIDGLSATESFTWLYYAVDKSVDRLQAARFPADLSKVAVITFTDGLDIGSLDEADKEEFGKYLSNSDYRNALNARLKNEEVSSVDISAYTIGIVNDKGTSLTTFRNNMNSLATSSKNVFEVDNIDNLNRIFQEIANSLSETNYVQTFALSISGQSHNEKCRFTFDNVSSYSSSKLYIEGVYDRRTHSLTNIKYNGLTSSSGTTVTGVYNDEGKYDFIFENLQASDGKLIPTDYVSHWFTDEGVWQDEDDEFFFNPDDKATVQKIKRSAAIMLNLDCSKSMNGTKLTKLKEAAHSFVQTLADNTIDPSEVSSVVLDRTNLSMTVGNTAALTATVLPATAKLKTVRWTSSNTTVASVDENTGLITAIAPGKAVITVTTKDGGFTASCEVTVTMLVNEISLDNTSLKLYNGETAALKASVLPDNASDKNVVWKSSKTSVATVDGSGNVTAVGAGTATITATASDGSGTEATCSVNVLQHVERISLDLTSFATHVGAAPGRLTATVLPENSNDKSVVWSSSDSSVVTVDEQGNVRGVAPGKAIISVTAMDGGFTASCEVTVTMPVDEIKLDNTSLELYNGETDTLKASVLPDNATDKNVVWKSSKTSVATVDSSGKVTAVGAGTATITATASDGSGKKATCSVKVLQHVERISLDLTSLTTHVGADPCPLTADVLPNNSNDKSVIWSSSDSSVATVDEQGNVRGVAPGKAIISVTAKDGGFTASCDVTVTMPVNEIKLDNTSLELYNGESATLKVSVLPDNATDKNVVWKSSKTSVATVDSSEKVTAVGAGTATITATASDGSGKKATCSVIVLQHVESVSIDKTLLNLLIGETAQLKATISPANASDQNLIWKSSDETVATVDNNGIVTAISKGTAKLTATSVDSNISAECQVTVSRPVSSIELDTSAVSLNVGETRQLSASVYPDNADNKELSWTTSKASVVKISATGLISAVAPGTATVYATATDGSGIKAKCTVTVIQPLAGIDVSSSAITLVKGDRETITVIPTPANATNTDYSVSTSNTGIVSVMLSDMDVTIEAIKIGTSTITITSDDGNYTATVAVTVTPTTTPSDLALSLKKNGVRYYIPVNEYVNAVGSLPTGYTKEGLTIKSAGGYFILSLNNASTSAKTFTNAQSLGTLPDREQAEAISSNWGNINSALTKYGGSSLGTQSYWTNAYRGYGTQGYYYNSSGVIFASTTTETHYARCIVATL